MAYSDDSGHPEGAGPPRPPQPYKSHAPHGSQSSPQYRPVPPPSPGMAVASLVLGGLGLFLSWFTFGIPSLIAVVLGAVAIKRANVSPGARAMATVGLVLGLIPVVVLGAFGVLLAAGYLASA